MNEERTAKNILNIEVKEKCLRWGPRTRWEQHAQE
jgi:hypothetical protein